MALPPFNVLRSLCTVPSNANRRGHGGFARFLRADYIYESINAGTEAMERSKTCGCSIILKRHLQLLNDFTAFLLGAFAGRL